MSKLYFRYGAMNSGKTTILLQVAYNYFERGQQVLIGKPAVDTKAGDKLSSRIGIERQIDFIVDNDFPELPPVDAILIDEAQFLRREHVNKLFEIAVAGTPVLAFGLRTDFKGNAFEGSQRLLEIAHSIEEMKTICRCGRKAVFNGRKIGDSFVFDGEQVAIDGIEATYESLCGQCYFDNGGVLH